MALVSTSQNVVDQSATPIAKVNPTKKGGVKRTAVGYLPAASFVGGTVGQWYTFVRLPVRARITDVLWSGATTTTGAVSVGLYRPDGIAIDAVCLNANIVTSAAKNRAVLAGAAYSATLRKDPISTSFATAIGTAGATGDSEVDVALTIVTVLGASIDHTVEVDYVMPD